MVRNPEDGGKPLSLTIAILAANVADHLPPCFASLRPLIAHTKARTLVILNQGGDPATARSARSLADTVIERHFENFSRQRNYALELAETDWLLFIDADERLTPPFATRLPRSCRGIPVQAGACRGAISSSDAKCDTPAGGPTTSCV